MGRIGRVRVESFRHLFQRCTYVEKYKHHICVLLSPPLSEISDLVAEAPARMSKQGYLAVCFDVNEARSNVC